MSREHSQAATNMKIIGPSGCLSGVDFGRIVDKDCLLQGRAHASSVAVCLQDQTLLAATIVALLKRVERIVLIPSEYIGRVATICAALKIDHVLADARIGNLTRASQGVIDLASVLEAAEKGTEQPQRPGDVSAAIVLATSGTSGQPKFVTHRAADLLADFARRPPKSSALIWGSLYHIDRFAGLQVLFQALHGGSKLILPSAHSPLERKVEMLSAWGCTALSGTPTMWRRILMAPSHRKLRLEQITLGGEIADGFILNALRGAFKEARISHVYASTEAGSLFAVHDGLPGFPIGFLNRSCPHRRLEIRDGRLFVQKPTGSGSYEGTNNAFRDESGFIDTGDHVETREGRVHFIGRRNTVINVGGNKAHPEEIESVILGVPGVHAANVMARKSSIMGCLVVADIVPSAQDSDGAELVKSVRTHCLRNLAPWKVPFKINIVRNISTGASGKIVRGMRA